MRVLLVGGGPQEAQLKQLAAELGVADKVVFTGRVPHGEVQRYYDLIDVLVYPRLSMRLTELVTPLKPLEAMAQGRLVAASGRRRAPRTDPRRRNRRAVQARRPRRAGGRGDETGRRAGALAAAQGGARRFVETERNWAASVARYEDVYARVMQQPRRT